MKNAMRANESSKLFRLEGIFFSPVAILDFLRGGPALQHPAGRFNGVFWHRFEDHAPLPIERYQDFASRPQTRLLAKFHRNHHLALGRHLDHLHGHSVLQGFGVVQQKSNALNDPCWRLTVLQMIMVSEAKLIDYETRRAHGEEIPKPTIQNEQRTKEDLLEKRRKLEDSIRKEVSLLPLEPRIVGVARIVPVPAPDSGLREDRDLAEIGMRVAMAYEQSQGRVPEDASLQNLGYDIRSTQDQAFRYIEVKARSRTGAVALTPNEWLMAQRLRDEYWLYIVENAASRPALHRIQNPAARLKPSAVVEIVRYVVAEWRQAVEASADGPESDETAEARP